MTKKSSDNIVAVRVGITTKEKLEEIGALIPHIVRESLEKVVDAYEDAGNPIPRGAIVCQFAGDTVEELEDARKAEWQLYHDYRAKAVFLWGKSQENLRVIRIINDLISKQTEGLEQKS